MSIPRHLNLPFSYQEQVGVTDVNTIISDVRTHLVTYLGWTEPSTALFKTPAVTGGEFFDLLLTRISATNLEIRMRNRTGATLFTRRVQILNPGVVRYYATTRSLVIECLTANPAASEIAQAYLLDVAPDDDGDLTNYSVGTAYRDSAGTVDGNGTAHGFLFAIDAGAAAALNRLIRNIDSGEATNPWNLNANLSMQARDAMISIDQQSNQRRWVGRLPQAMIVGPQLPSGCCKKLAIDDHTTGLFKALGLFVGHVEVIALRVA